MAKTPTTKMVELDLLTRVGNNNAGERISLNSKAAEGLLKSGVAVEASGPGPVWHPEKGKMLGRAVRDKMMDGGDAATKAELDELTSEVEDVTPKKGGIFSKK